MRIVYKAPEFENEFSIHGVQLNAEIENALGSTQGWAAFHNAHEAIVDLSPEREGDEALVRQVIEAHIANTATREARKAIDAQIAALEAKVTPRMLREQALGIADGRLKAINSQIATLRSTRP